MLYEGRRSGTHSIAWSYRDLRHPARSEPRLCPRLRAASPSKALQRAQLSPPPPSPAQSHCMHLHALEALVDGIAARSEPLRAVALRTPDILDLRAQP